MRWRIQHNTPGEQLMIRQPLNEGFFIRILPDGEHGPEAQAAYIRHRHESFGIMTLLVDIPAAGREAVFEYATTRWGQVRLWLRKKLG